MNRVYQITAVVFFLFSAYIAKESLALRFYTSLGPGPGFFPFWLSLMLGALSAMLFYQGTWGSRRNEPLPEDFFATRVGYFRIAAMVLATAVVVVSLEPLGFRLTMLAYLLFLIFGLGRVNLFLTALVSLAGSFGLYYGFVELLKIPLPTGVFGF